MQEELESLQCALERHGTVNINTTDYAILSLVCNAGKSSTILRQVFSLFEQHNMHPTMISQGSSKTSISMLVPDGSMLQQIMNEVHAAFFNSDGNLSVPVSFPSTELEADASVVTSQ